MATVDLRPMSLGEVLDRTFTLYRERFLLFAGIAALPYLLVLVLKFAFLLITRSNLQNINPGTNPGALAGLVGGFLVGVFVVGGIWLIALGIAHGATIWAVSELYLGREVTVRDAYAQSLGRILVVVTVTVMVFLAAAFVSIVTFFLLFIPGIYLGCRLALSVPVAVVEKEGPVASMERSMELTKGYFWQMFLLLLLAVAISLGVTYLLATPAMILAFKALVARQQVSMGVTIYQYISEFVAQAVVGPVGTISASLMYYNLRVQKEGFDIQHLLSALGNSSSPRPLAM